MPNRVLPESLTFDASLVACSRAARTFFFHLYLKVDDCRRLLLGPSPENPVVLRALCHPAEADVRIPDVARWLKELSHAGAVAIRDSDRGWYVEIAEHLWYRREDFREGQPKWGPRKPVPPAQPTLPGMGPVGIVEGGAAVEPPGVPHGAMPTWAQSKTNPKSKSKPNLPRGRGEDSGTRALRAGGDSGDSEKSDAAKRERGDFARDESAFPHDAAWGDVVRELGEAEMWACGAMWADRWTLAHAALGAAHRDWRTLDPAQRAEGSFAKYLTAAWKRVLSGERGAA